MKKIILCILFFITFCFSYGQVKMDSVPTGNTPVLRIPVPSMTWYRDKDGDGYGAKLYDDDPVYSNTKPAGYVNNSDDYDDYTPNITNVLPQYYFRDNDLDSFGNPNLSVYYSIKPNGFVSNNMDCNDLDASINPNTIWYRDADGDGYGIASNSVKQCVAPAGYVRNTADLDDTTPNITNTSPKTFYRDADGDGYGDPYVIVYYSVQPAGYVTNNTDCNDSNASINPNLTWFRDADGDGYGGITLIKQGCNQPPGYVSNQDDYDDNNGNITNIAPEYFYQDYDGDGFGNLSVSVYISVKPSGYVTNYTDCNDGDLAINPNTVWYRDADGDLHGDAAVSVVSCIQPVGYVRNANDYNDSTSYITNIAPNYYYQDADTDGYGNPSVYVYYSYMPGGFVSNNFDCNDGESSLNPNTVWYQDADGDGYGNESVSVASCSQPSGYLRIASDYNDTTANITNVAPNYFYQDSDGDGYGNPSVYVYYSYLPGGFVTNNYDCNDADGSLNPNTLWYRDADADGYGNGAVTANSCTQPNGYIRQAGDYDDTTGNIINIAPQYFYRDADGDGYGHPSIYLYYSYMPGGYVANNYDCNDGDNTLNPNTIWYQDADADGFGNSAVIVNNCTQPNGYIRQAGDYDDTTGNIINITPQYFYRDADGDGYGSPSIYVYYSYAPGGYVANNYDCNDGDSALNPNTIWYQDVDADGYGNSAVIVNSCTKPIGYIRQAGDFDDSNVNITNVAPQYFYRDADADGYGNAAIYVYYSYVPGGYVSNNLDCNDSDASLNPDTVWYQDADGDGYGNTAITATSCFQPSGYVSQAGDYNDGTVNIINVAPQYFYQDADGDGYGNESANVYYSFKPGGYVTNNLDCNDSDASLSPNTIWYRDTDGDGYGALTTTAIQCVQPVGYVRNSSDYNDSTANITNIAPQYFYHDADGDGYGNAAVNVYYSILPNGYVSNNLDCNDSDSGLNPNTKWYADNDLDGLGDASNYVEQCTIPSGNYVRNNSDNCPQMAGSSSDCSNIVTPSDYNYIITKKYKEPTDTVIESPSLEQVHTSITYFDGLGRPIQQIANRQSATGTDIITHIGYDNFGRQNMEYLPYVSSSSNMAFETNAKDNTATFYNTQNYDNTSNPYSEKQFEPSPLNRILKQAAPGNSWAMGSGHEIKLDYRTNTADEVKLYQATATWSAGSGLYDISFSDAGFYTENQLYKTITYDENTSASPVEGSGSTVEFKNKEGQVVLKRNYDGADKHDTYYVYDIYGNLTYVIPPKVEGTIDSAVLNGLCYQYKYDDKNRLAEKKLPGRQWEFLVYDRLDRPVATGPATSPFTGDSSVGWIITKYDAFGRPVYTGWSSQTSNAATRKSLQDAQNIATVLFESKQTSGTIDGIETYYSNVIAPVNFKLLTVNYYDNYAFPNAQAAPSSIEGQEVLANIKGMSSGTWTRAVTTVSSTAGETSTIFYDDKARPIKNYTQNYLGGYNSSESKLDFTGKTLYTITKHKRTSGNPEIVVREEFTYSPQDRLLTHTHQINGGAVELLADNSYDALGQLVNKKVGNNAGNPLQKVDYKYNIRGWLEEINKTINLQQDTDPVDLFAFKINYDITQTAISDIKALYNGNISETFWKTASNLNERAYGYKYDNLNRLKNAVYEKNGLTTSAYDENLTYDKNGNIKTLSRNGDFDPQVGKVDIDDLVYTYETNSNRLSKVADNSNNSSGFNDANKTDDDYSYDDFGNLITDKNKNITEITYNHLNLPKKITFGTTGSIEYIYNTAGQKLEKIVTEGTVTTTTNYLAGYQYKDNVLEFFPTAEGYVKNTAGVLSYVYQYKDHLGNVRVSYAKNPTTQVLEIIDETHYYPFGLKHNGYVSIPEGSNKFKYNGKELQDELGLNMYDYGARNYDSALGRWINLDNLSEEYSDYSPYVYAFNDPVRHIDPDGNAPEDRLGEIDPPGKSKQSSPLSKSTIVNYSMPVKMQGGYFGQSLDEVVTAGIQWLGGQLSGSEVSKETSEDFQLATSLAIMIVSKGKNAKADGEVVEQLTKAESVASKKVPNPNGKKGSQAHQHKIGEYEKKLQDKGWDVTRERKVNTEGGHKNSRYTDLTASKDGKTLNVQVGKANKNGKAVSRERKAIEDINNSTKNQPNGSNRTIFVPYNK